MAKQRKREREHSAATVLRFSENHLWIKVEGGRTSVGLSDFGQRDLGGIIATELPDVGDAVEQGEPFGELESKRTVQELVSPVSGEVTAVNTDIETNPELINEDPYHDGWLIEVELSDESELDALMGADEYDELAADNSGD